MQLAQRLEADILNGRLVGRRGANGAISHEESRAQGCEVTRALYRSLRLDDLCARIVREQAMNHVNTLVLRTRRIIRAPRYL